MTDASVSATTAQSSRMSSYWTAWLTPSEHLYSQLLDERSLTPSLDPSNKTLKLYTEQILEEKAKDGSINYVPGSHLSKVC